MSPHDTHDDDATEALLRAARPAPGLGFAGELERNLFPQRTRLRDRRLFAGFATATALASAFLVFSLVGGGPLAPSGGDDARAKGDCMTVYVTKVEPAGEVVRRADGTVTVETARKPVTRAVERCR